MDSSDERLEIAFFDVETTIPSRSGQGFALLEFGAIIVCPRKLHELECYSTLIRPKDLSSISAASVRCNGITQDAVVGAPSFREVADRVYNILHGRVWAGHNIIRFDCVRIREAFAEIGRPAPEPKGTIDSLVLLTQRFGRRAGNMKMASLASYFGLGQQQHRCLGDVRMNLEVLKYCATVLFLESSLPDIFTTNSWISPNATTRSHNGTSSNGTSLIMNTPPSNFRNCQRLSPTNGATGTEVLHPVESNVAQRDPFDMGTFIDQIKTESMQVDAALEERSVRESPGEGCSGYAGFLEPDEILIPFISGSLLPSYRGGQRIQLLHKDIDLQVCCTGLKVCFGISAKFHDRAGRPRLSIVVEPTPGLCQVLDTCDRIAQKLSVDSGSSSEWRPVVTRKNGFLNSSTIRLHIPTIENDIAIYATEIYQKEPSGSTQKLVFSRFDAAELDSLFVPGTFVDAHFSFEVYDYQQYAGIRLLAKKLMIDSKK